MKLGDKVIYEQPGGDPPVEAIVAGIVPIGCNPVQHPEEVEGSDKWYYKSRKLMGGAPKDHVSYMLAVPNGFHKDGTKKPDNLIWPKVEHIKLIKPKETPKSSTRKGK